MVQFNECARTVRWRATYERARDAVECGVEQHLEAEMALAARALPTARLARRVRPGRLMRHVERLAAHEVRQPAAALPEELPGHVVVRVREGPTSTSTVERVGGVREVGVSQRGQVGGQVAGGERDAGALEGGRTRVRVRPERDEQTANQQTAHV